MHPIFCVENEAALAGRQPSVALKVFPSPLLINYGDKQVNSYTPDCSTHICMGITKWKKNRSKWFQNQKRVGHLEMS